MRLSKLPRRLDRHLRRRKLLTPLLVIVLLIGIISYAGYMNSRRLSVDPASYSSLLALIGKVESNSNYNAYFGNASNQKVDFTAMTIADVLQWQKAYVQKGSPSSAIGKYQIIDTTLAGLVNELELDTSQRFDQATQDTLAIALLERRGAEKYLNDELSKEELAANLAMEWAALPKTLGSNPEKSYYDGDGLNSSRAEVAEVLNAIEPISAK